jgi:ATP-binding cassette subfamily B multidrug efflux pump
MKFIKKSEHQIDDISGKLLDDWVFFRLAPYLRPHFIGLALCSLLVLASAGVALYTPKLLGQIVDRALVPKNSDLLLQLGLLYGALELIRLTAIFFQSYGLQRIGQRVMHSIRGELFARITRMPTAFFDKYPVGKLVTRVTNDTVNLSELFSSGFVMLMSDLLLIIGVIVAMIVLHWKLGLIAISVFPIMVLFMIFFSGRLREAFRRSRELLSRVNAFFAERMGGMPVVQLMEREKYERERYRALSTEYRDRQFDGVYLYSLFHPAITVLSGASVALVILFGPYFIGQEEIALGTFVSFLAYVQVLYQPVRNITDRYNVFLAAMSSAERIFTLIDMPEEAGLREKGSEGKLPGEISFENVSFSYEQQSTNGSVVQALNEVSFKVSEGETVAIVGHTGAGKTTITSLLFRFYEIQTGRILLGGRDIKSFPKALLRSRIGFVQQEVFLFSGSLRENLSLLRSDASDQEILAACEKTGFSHVLKKLPEGLNTELDERGSNLSLGERQILVFTRVFLQRPDILVLDEATSSVDSEAEQRIQLATKELVRGRTSLVIAHRLETVMKADRILVFEKGKLVESGSHSELLEKKGLYAHFVNLQFSGPATGAQSTVSI